MWAALFERQLAIQLLGVQIPAMARPPLPGASNWTRIKAHLSWPATWRSLGYLVVRVPAGFLAGIGVLFAIVLGLAMLTTPLAYLAGIGGGTERRLMGMSVAGGFNAGDMLLSLSWGLSGAALIIVVLHVCNGLDPSRHRGPHRPGWWCASGVDAPGIRHPGTAGNKSRPCVQPRLFGRASLG
ncbi:MAG: sensor domain-containing protein [Candidatus Dormibacteria bacterium]